MMATGTEEFMSLIRHSHNSSAEFFTIEKANFIVGNFYARFALDFEASLYNSIIQFPLLRFISPFCVMSCTDVSHNQKCFQFK